MKIKYIKDRTQLFQQLCHSMKILVESIRNWYDQGILELRVDPAKEESQLHTELLPALLTDIGLNLWPLQQRQAGSLYLISNLIYEQFIYHWTPERWVMEHPQGLRINWNFTLALAEHVLQTVIR